jgi:hypothetical protein
MSKDPESVPFVRRVLQISQTDERWFTLARHVAIVDQCAYSSPFTRDRVLFFDSVSLFNTAFVKVYQITENRLHQQIAGRINQRMVYILINLHTI